MNLLHSKKFQINTVTTIIAVYLLARLLHAFVPQFHSDPLYYHATAPWRWSQAGGFIHFDWLPWYLQGGLAEYLLAFVAALFDERLYFLMTSQILNLLAGSFVAGFFLYRILLEYVSKPFALLGILCFITFPEEGAMLIRAKNDGYVLASFCASLFFFLRVTDQEKPASIANILCLHLSLAIALAMKHTALFFIAPMALWVLIESFYNESTRRRLAVHVGFFTLFLPIGLSTMARNYYFTSNPVFPSLYYLFPTPFIDQYIKNEVAYFSRVPGSLWVIISVQLGRYLFAKPAFLLTLLVPKRPKSLYFLFWAGVFLVMLITGQGFSTRFGFFLFATASLLFSINAYNWAEKFNKVTLFFWLGILAAAINGRIEVTFQAVYKDIPTVFRDGAEAFTVKKYPLFTLHKETRSTLPESAFIWSEYDNSNFFLDCKLATPENHIGASRVLASKTYPKLIEALKDEGFTHIQMFVPYTEKTAVLRTGTFLEDFKKIRSVSGTELWELVRK